MFSDARLAAITRICQRCEPNTALGEDTNDDSFDLRLHLQPSYTLPALWPRSLFFRTGLLKY
jgi:hypothetical protein